MKTIPTLESERLRLRAHRMDDFDDAFTMWSNPAVTRFIGEPSTKEQAQSRIVNYLTHWVLMGFGYWAVEEKATGAFVGDIGLADFRREIEPSILGTPEAGWVLTPAAQGKGYATEGLTAVLAWAGKNMATKKTVCLISPDNVASLRVAEKLGYKEYAQTTFKGEPTILFERVRP